MWAPIQTSKTLTSRNWDRVYNPAHCLQGELQYWAMSGELITALDANTTDSFLLTSDELFEAACFSHDAMSLLIVSDQHIYLLTSEDWLFGYQKRHIQAQCSILETEISPRSTQFSRLGHHTRATCQILPQLILASDQSSDVGYAAVCWHSKSQGSLIWWPQHWNNAEEYKTENLTAKLESKDCLAFPSFLTMIQGDRMWTCQAVLDTMQSYIEWLDGLRFGNWSILNRAKAPSPTPESSTNAIHDIDFGEGETNPAVTCMQTNHSDAATILLIKVSKSLAGSWDAFLSNSDVCCVAEWRHGCCPSGLQLCDTAVCFCCWSIYTWALVRLNSNGKGIRSLDTNHSINQLIDSLYAGFCRWSD